MELCLQAGEYYRVKRGQTLEEVARAFSCPPAALARCNALTREIEEGEVLRIPPRRNVYTVQGGETRALLCGSREQFFLRNGTHCLYPLQEVFL